MSTAPIAQGPVDVNVSRRCEHCDDTGDVTALDGEYRGPCNCGAPSMFQAEMANSVEIERFFPFEFEVWQGDEMVASASGPRDDALREAMNYAAQYEQDGPVRVFEVTRTLVTPNRKVGAGDTAKCTCNQGPHAAYCDMYAPKRPNV